MLVDLGRNDVAGWRLADRWKVGSLMQVERYSHVMQYRVPGDRAIGTGQIGSMT